MYYLIGISLLFTFLFTINVASSLAATGLWSVLQRFATSWSPARRSGAIFALRIVPIIAAFVFILAFVLPSFLLYEPRQSGETIGLKLTLIVGIAAFGF